MTRLNAICSLIHGCNCIADIGCDHGKVSEFIFSSKLCDKLIVNDISDKSIQKAKIRLTTALQNDATNKTEVEFITADGACLKDNAIDCAIIAGVGGYIVCDIIKSLSCQSFVISPQNYVHGVRELACELGYQITYDKTVHENGKFYDIIKITKGVADTLDIFQLYYGKQCREFNQDLLDRLYINEKSFSSFTQTQQNQEKLRIIREVIKWQLLNK